MFTQIKGQKGIKGKDFILKLALFFLLGNNYFWKNVSKQHYTTEGSRKMFYNKGINGRDSIVK